MDGVRHLHFTSFNGEFGSLEYGMLEGSLLNATSAPSNSVTIGMLLSGRARIFLNSTEYELQPGNAIIYFPGDLAIQKLEDTTALTLRLSASNLKFFQLSVMSHRVKESIPRILPRTAAEDLVTLCEFAQREFNRTSNRSDWMTQVSPIGRAMIDRVSTHLDGILESIGTATPRTLDICMNAFQFLLNNIHRPVSIEELSEAANCGVRTLYRAYDMAANTTPVDHSNRIRVTRGRSLLFSRSPTQLSLKSISEQCGFFSPKTFLDAYKCEFGLTPHQTMALYKDCRTRMLNSKVLSALKS